MSLSRSLWRGGLWDSQVYANGLWRGGLWNSDRLASLIDTEQLRQTLSAYGPNFFLFNLRPIVDGVQVLWQDTAGTVPVDTDGQVVGLAQDLSGSDMHVTQGTAGKKLIYRTDGVSHWLEADGVDDAINSAMLGFAASQPTTMAVRAKANATAGSVDIMDAGTNTSANRNQLGIRSGNFEIFAGTILNNGAADLIKHTFYAEFNGASSIFDIDATSTSGSAGGNAPDSDSKLALAALNNGSAEFFQGNIYGVVYVFDALSAEDEQEVKDYLNNL